MGSAAVSAYRMGLLGVAVALAAIGAPSSSLAQDVVVMRKVIAAPRPVVYTPVYSSSYGSCSGGSQSAPITGCKAPDGSPAPLSACSSSPRTVSRKCSDPVCGQMKVGFWSTRLDANGTVLSTSTVDAAAARSLCQSYAVANGKRGACALQTRVGYVNFYEGLGLTSTGSAANYAAVCE